MYDLGLKFMRRNLSTNYHKFPKKIVIYTDAFYPNKGGGESYCLDLAHTLSSMGFEVVVVTSVKSKYPDNFKFKVHRLNYSVSLSGFNINFFEVLRYIIKENPYLVHISGPTVMEEFLIPALRILKIPVLLTFHGQFNGRMGKTALALFGRLSYRHLDRILVQSQRDFKYIERLKVYSKRVELLYFNGIDLSKYQCTNRQYSESTDAIREERVFQFIFVGGLTKSRPYKGIDVLVRTFIKNDRTDFHNKSRLIIVGSGDLFAELKEDAIESKNVVFRGQLNEDEKIKELCSSDALILPSVTQGEGFGRVALEAISCGTPVLVSKYAGISELIDKYKAGLIFDPNDEKDFIIKMRLAITDKDLLSSFSHNGMEMIRQEGLDLLSTTTRTVQIYEDISK